MPILRPWRLRWQTRLSSSVRQIDATDLTLLAVKGKPECRRGVRSRGTASDMGVWYLVMAGPKLGRTGSYKEVRGIKCTAGFGRDHGMTAGGTAVMLQLENGEQMLLASPCKLSCLCPYQMSKGASQSYLHLTSLSVFCSQGESRILLPGWSESYLYVCDYCVFGGHQGHEVDDL